MNNLNLNLSDIIYHDKSKDRQFVKCSGGGKYKCKKYKYWKDFKTKDEAMRFLTSKGWVKTEENLRSRMWRCPKCSDIDKDIALNQQPDTNVSEVALQNKRDVWMHLLDFYDTGKKTYKSKHSDQSIAKLCGIAESVVKEMRLEYYGPIADPDPFEVLNNKVDALKKELIVMVGNRIDDFHNEIQKV